MRCLYLHPAYGRVILPAVVPRDAWTATYQAASNRYIDSAPVTTPTVTWVWTLKPGKYQNRRGGENLTAGSNPSPYQVLPLVGVWGRMGNVKSISTILLYMVCANRCFARALATVPCNGGGSVHEWEVRSDGQHQGAWQTRTKKGIHSIHSDIADSMGDSCNSILLTVDMFAVLSTDLWMTTVQPTLRLLL